jgi:hypothetical protein
VQSQINGLLSKSVRRNRTDIREAFSGKTTTNELRDRTMQIKTQAGKAHQIKNTAIAFGVYGNGSKRLGDIAVTNKGLVWSNGVKSAKDVAVKWDAFIDWMQSQLGPQANKAKTAKAPKAGKSAKLKKAAKPRSRAAANGASMKTSSKAKAAPAKKASTKPAAKSKSAPKKPH